MPEIRESHDQQAQNLSSKAAMARRWRRAGAPEGAAPPAPAPAPARAASTWAEGAAHAARAGVAMCTVGAGDSYLIPDFLSPAEADAALMALTPLKMGGLAEVAWMQMFGANKRPFGRLKFTQATVERDLEPIYRYPTNNQSACLTHSWTPTVKSLKDKVEACIGQGLNHCVGNLYQDEKDFIGPHTDKMLDILQGSCIVSLSLGAERPILLERKRDKEQQKVSLPHGSLFVLGPETNRHWSHSIPAQGAKLGHRISLTIRKMGTFLQLRTRQLVGQGADKPTLNWPEWEHDESIVPEVAHPQAKQPLAELRASTRFKGSSFECVVRPCSDHAEVQACWREFKLQYREACHIPYAFVLTMRGRRVTGSEADGEPVGKADTAAEGLLEPLLAAGLTDCACFVVRHWDGERLGLANLIRAYAEAVQAAVAFAPACTSTRAVALTTPAEEVLETGAEDVDRQVRKLKKALREISALEQLQKEGTPLQQNQIWKIQKRQEYVSQLAVLEK
ncbi:unnamed protein product [Effrenium voratum]|uniref:Fe2OG dioxygenase domain-containing protein n=1 Tax=Effrenium voratum TaxID=2562239 RepID=A0AA36MTB7_9DINO|nr:unnamed protein product [Effrenium voratum]CAJ1448233.1 unnamed protein product [Effrenium voratum]